MSIYWGLLFFILLFIEVITINLVSIWFAIGAVFAMVVSLFTDNLIIQLVTFIVISIISLILTKPIVKKFNNTKKTPTNLDRVIGKVGEVTKRITAHSYGEVKVFGTVWTAASNKTIEVGEKVIVNKIEGVKLIVSKNKEEK